MKNRIIIITFCLLLFSFRGVQASSCVSNDISRLEPQYIVQTNGMLAVCALDYSRGLLLRVKGMNISRSQLSQSGYPCVYEIGDRPSISTNLWKTPKDYHNYYGKIPYPVKDVDPVFSSYWNKKGELLIGVRVRNQFYVVKNLGKVKKNIAAKKVIEIQPPMELLDVNLPEYRTNDLDNVSAKIRAKYGLPAGD